LPPNPLLAVHALASRLESTPPSLGTMHPILILCLFFLQPCRFINKSQSTGSPQTKEDPESWPKEPLIHAEPCKEPTDIFQPHEYYKCIDEDVEYLVCSDMGCKRCKQEDGKMCADDGNRGDLVEEERDERECEEGDNNDRYDERVGGLHHEIHEDFIEESCGYIHDDYEEDVFFEWEGQSWGLLEGAPWCL
jgi:hypothetical protein